MKQEGHQDGIHKRQAAKQKVPPTRQQEQVGFSLSSENSYPKAELLEHAPRMWESCLISLFSLRRLDSPSRVLPAVPYCGVGSFDLFHWSYMTLQRTGTLQLYYAEIRVPPPVPMAAQYTWNALKRRPDLSLPLPGMCLNGYILRITE